MAASALSKLKRFPGFAVLLTYIFVVSGVIVGGLSILLLVIWPFSKNLYRRVVSLLLATLSGQFVWIAKDWAGMEMTLFGEEEAFKRFGKERCLITLSHRGDLDWVGGFIMGAHFGFLRSIRTLPKKSVLFVPGLGLALWATESVFLSRNYTKDVKTITKTSHAYREYPFPLTVTLFCEGTRFTVEKHAKSVEYAREKGYRELKHHLVPRVKGFSILAQQLKTNSKFPALYDVGFAYPGITELPSHITILLGKPVHLYWYMRRIPMSGVPSSLEELNSYCYNLYVHKDEAYEHFTKHGVFPGPSRPLPPATRTVWLLRLNQLVWFLLLCVAPTTYFCTVLSWYSLAMVVAGGFLFNAVLMVALLLYARGGHVNVSHHDLPDNDALPPTKKKTD